jgi:hypothetical protein
VRDLLFLNEGNGPDGRARFREVGRSRRHRPPPYDHSLGAVFTDVNGDGRPDLYVANDEDPNRLYVNEPGGPRASTSSTVAAQAGVADTNAGMGIAAQAGLLFVSNSRGQSHASYRQVGKTRFRVVLAAAAHAVTAVGAPAGSTSRTRAGPTSCSRTERSRSPGLQRVRGEKK